MSCKSKACDTMPFPYRSYISLLEDEQLSEDDDADDICLQIALQESTRCNRAYMKVLTSIEIFFESV